MDGSMASTRIGFDCADGANLPQHVHTGKSDQSRRKTCLSYSFATIAFGVVGLLIGFFVLGPIAKRAMVATQVTSDGHSLRKFVPAGRLAVPPRVQNGAKSTSIEGGGKSSALPSYPFVRWLSPRPKTKNNWYMTATLEDTGEADDAMEKPVPEQSTQKGFGTPKAEVKPKVKERKIKVKAPKEKVKAVVPMREAERVFFEGGPSATEVFVPAMSLPTVVGAIPFVAALSRQAWTRYKITNYRFDVKSGFQGNDVAQIAWKEVISARWIRRWGGKSGDLVLSLKDGAKLEVTSVPEFERNLAFIMDRVDLDVREECGYPDRAAREYKEQVDAGELPPPTLESVPERQETEASESQFELPKVDLPKVELPKDFKLPNPFGGEK